MKTVMQWLHDGVDSLDKDFMTAEGCMAVKAVAKLKELMPGESDRMDLLAELWVERDGKGMNWETTGSAGGRDETQLRLNIMGRMKTWSPALTTVVTFYFRSSDPLLYQEAAITIGKHIGRDDELRNYIKEYARLHNIDLEAPVRLSAKRSSRRLALVCAADTNRKLELRIPESGLKDKRQAHLSDLIILFRIYHLLLSSITGKTELRQLIEQAATVTDDALNAESVLNRRAGFRLGQLISTVGRIDPSGISTRLSGILIRLLHRYSSTSDAAQKMMLLDSIDEIIRVALTIPEINLENVLQEIESKSDRHALNWVKLRVKTYMVRSGIESDLQGYKYLFINEIYDSSYPEWWPVFLGVNEDTKGDGFMQDRAGRRKKLLVEIDRMTESDETWDKLPVQEQALSGFIWLDLCRHAYEQAVSQEEKDQAKEKLAQAYRTLLDRMDAGKPYLDSSLIHSMSDEQGLLKLLGLGSEAVPVYDVADALENRMRVGIGSNTNFDAAIFLFRIAAIQPAAGFRLYFSELLENRTYINPDGTEIPVRRWLTYFFDSDNQSEEESEPAGSSFFDVYVKWRKNSFSDSPENESITKSLEGFCRMLAGEGDRPGLSDVLNRLDNGRGESDSAELRRIAESIRVRLAALKLHGLMESAQALHAADDIAGSVKQVEEIASKWTGRRLSGRIKDMAERIRGLLNSYKSVTARITTEMNALLKKKIVERAEALRSVLRPLQDLPEGEIRYRIGAFVVEALLMHTHKGELKVLLQNKGGRSDAWMQEFRLLSIMLEPESGLIPDTEEVKEVMTASWLRLAEAAMQAGHENRLFRLIEPGAMQTLYEHQACRGRLSDIRHWYLNRYNVQKAWRVSRIAKTESGTDWLYPLRLNSFLGHYNAVWVALLIGAILMLDFGDAWAEMADIGDMRGIFITFIISVIGAFGYVYSKLRQQVEQAPEDRTVITHGSWIGRTLFFIALCLLFSFVIAGGLWWLLSGTDEVVHGDGAWLHITVWASFALFIGVFFGLIAKTE